MDQKLSRLIDGLNEDLAHEYAAIISYNHYAATVSGLSRQFLKPFFLSEVQEETGHATFLADKIISLGGIPTTTPKPVKHTEQVKEILTNLLEAEKDTIKRYADRIEQAEQAQEFALKLKLEEMLAEETVHMEELERLLQDPRL